MELRAWVERLMGLGPEWRIKRVDECGRACPGYDARPVAGI